MIFLHVSLHFILMGTKGEMYLLVSCKDWTLMCPAPHVLANDSVAVNAPMLLEAGGFLGPALADH